MPSWLTGALARRPLIARQSRTPQELFGYLPHADCKLYYVLHAPRGRCWGQVLMAGPFGTGRATAYLAWVRWARYLAHHGLEVMRFDYSGTGESTGNMPEMDCERWLEDLVACAQWLRRRNNGVPLLLHGVELGALLAGKAFNHDLGHALLAWSPPPSGREILQYALRLRVAADYMHRARQTSADYIAQLESGRVLNVAGYSWGMKLWQTAADLKWTNPPAADSSPWPWRPWRVQELDERAGSLYQPWDGTVPSHRIAQELAPDFRSFFKENFVWIRRWLKKPGSEHHA